MGYLANIGYTDGMRNRASGTGADSCTRRGDWVHHLPGCPFLALPPVNRRQSRIRGDVQHGQGESQCRRQDYFSS